MTGDRNRTSNDKPLTGTAHQQRNEGEGSRTAARKYDEEAERFARSGKAEAKAEEARDAVDADKRGELAEAEAEGRRHSKGEDPELRRK